MIRVFQSLLFSFVSLVSAISQIKPRYVHRNSEERSKLSPVYRTFCNWIAELHKRYEPLPPGTTGVIFRLLFPEEDIGRKYGMQETALAQQLATTLLVSTSSNGRGSGLTAWNGEGSTGCLGHEVERLMENTSTVRALLQSVYPTWIQSSRRFVGRCEFA